MSRKRNRHDFLSAGRNASRATRSIIISNEIRYLSCMSRFLYL